MTEVVALSPFHAAALGLSRRGIPVFPCQPGSKYPACSRGFKDATTEVAQINRWWREDRFRNVAFPSGSASGIDVLDIDGGGETTLALLEERQGIISPSIEVISGNGGRHIYLRHVPGARSSVRGLGEGIDYKGDGGYVLVPPSIHPKSQRPYVYSVDCAGTIADAPEWLAALVVKMAGTNGHANGKSAEDWRAMFAAGVGEGKRNSTVASLVGHLLRREVDLGVAYELALAFNNYRCAPPLTDGEVVGIVESIGKRELQRRNGNG